MRFTLMHHKDNGHTCLCHVTWGGPKFTSLKVCFDPHVLRIGLDADKPKGMVRASATVWPLSLTFIRDV